MKIVKSTIQSTSQIEKNDDRRGKYNTKKIKLKIEMLKSSLFD